jgi:DNA-binding NarL/FixJ family response regulator
MTIGRDRLRVLLVSDDDAFSAQLKPRLPAYEVLSLTESSVWMANRAGLDVTRGVDAVLLDHQVTGRLQLGLYETLRPSDGLARIPVIFTRSKLTAATGGFDHELDIYQPESASLDETARLVEHVLGGPPEPVMIAQRRPVPRRPERRLTMPPRVASRLAAPAATAVASRAQRAGAALGPGLLQRLALWGIATALIGFTFWPLVGSGPVRDAVYGPLQAFSGGSSAVTSTAMKARIAR